MVTFTKAKPSPIPKNHPIPGKGSISKKAKVVPYCQIPLEYKTDVTDAVDNWLKSYKSATNDKSNRQRKRMKHLLEMLS